MFITFEGVDYSGKSTQARMLSEKLKKDGYEVLVLREPGGTEIGEKIRQILLDSKNSNLTDAAELFLFSASRSQLVEQVIKPALRNGNIVICDRFFDSTTAYQGYGRGVPIEVINILNGFATNGLLPDITFLIDIPILEIEKRMRLSNASKDRMESNDNGFYRRVREGFLEIAKLERRFRIIDGLKTMEEINELIYNEVTKNLNLRRTV